MVPRILVLNGSLGRESGNTAALLRRLTAHWAGRAEVEVITLGDVTDFLALEKALARSDAFVFATGTYWDSWGSPLQRFFEETTHLEATDAWMGKPAAAIVTMHSVGGKGVLSRLQGVLNTLGLFVPPMSGLVYSAAVHAGSHGDEALGIRADGWQLDDLAVVAENLLTATRQRAPWRAWPVDREDPRRTWLR